jgi:hypothetical protein
MDTLTLEFRSAINAIVVLQTLIAFLIAIVGWFIKRELTSISRKFEQHEKLFFDLNGALQRVIGKVEIWNGVERRG